HTLLLISGTADRWSIPTLAEVLLAGRLLGLSETGPTSVEHDWRHRMQFGSYIGREAALLMLAATPGNSPEAVRACQAYWQAFRTAGLLDADLDVATVGFPEELEKLNKQGRRQVTDGVAIVENSRTLAVSARGPIRDIEINGHRLIIAEQLPPVGTRVDLDPFFDALAEAVAETPRAYQPEWGVRLAELTGMPLVDAHLLAAGLPGFGDSENNFLPKDLRTAMKLKVTEANQARDRLQKHGDLLPRLLAVAVPVDDPARLLTDGPDIDAMAELWKAEVGSGPALPTEVVTAKPNWVSDEVLTQLISGNSSEFWRTDPSWDHTLAEAALWLAWELPADSPLRTEMSQALSHARDAFHSLPRLRQLGHDSLGVSRRLLGLPPRPEQGEKDILVVRAFRVNGVEYWSELVTILPTDLTGPDDPDVAIARAICDELRSGDDILWLLTDQINPFIEGVLPIDRPGVVQDPRVTVPTLVAEVAAEHGVSEEAAAYYLQLLALARPTDRNIQAWNGWTRAQRVAAGAELVAKDLVVEGKRARAGRTLFLPGGWLEMSAPNLPMETWKTPWHAVRVMESGRGQQRLEGTPALLPPAELFAAAWARSRGDDGPGFGELQTTRKGIR
ncbi:MAG: hypothetical protein Q4G46_02510, partial [Propionibacteriaceae bacterium]|nr:hypothetical protein [Propionibacteriaceae bacterium]